MLLLCNRYELNCTISVIFSFYVFFTSTKKASEIKVSLFKCFKNAIKNTGTTPGNPDSERSGQDQHSCPRTDPERMELSKLGDV